MENTPNNFTQLSLSTSKWQIESLMKSAFQRTKTRFLSYFLTLIVCFGLVIGFAILAFFIGAIGFVLFSVLKLELIGLIYVFLAPVLLVFFSIYLFSWMQLAIVDILIQEEKKGVIETFKKVKPYTLDYIWLVSLNSLFIFGLLPFGLLSFFIIYLLWGFWGIFTLFIYLEKRNKGLRSLWLSRSMVNQKFWGILGRILLLQLSILFVNMLLISSKNTLLGFSAGIISLLTTPFTISFNYAMYKNLQLPQEVRKPVVWIALAIIGGVLLVVLLAISINALINWLPVFFQNQPWRNIPKFNPPLPYPSIYPFKSI